MTGGGPPAAEAPDQLRSVLDAAGLGIFDYDSSTRSVSVDRRTRMAFGFESGDRFPLADLLGVIHPDDRSVVADALNTAARELGSYSVEHRVCPPGGERWLDVHGQGVRGDDDVVHVLGTVRDSTDVRRAMDEVARVLEHVGETFLSVSPDGRVTYVNARAEQMLRRTRESLVGGVPWQDFPGLLGERLDEVLRSAVPGDDATVLEDYSSALGIWVELRIHPGTNGTSIYVTDVTTRRARRERNRRLREIAAAFARALTPDEVSGVVVEHALRGVAADAAGVFLADQEHRELRLIGGLDRLREPMRSRWSRVSMSAHTPLNEALESGEPQLLTASEAVDAFPHLSRDVLELGAGFYAIIPLVTAEPALGLLVLGWAERDGMDDDELAFLVAVAAQCAQAVERAQLYEQQRRIAESLQRSLLPQRLPDIPAVDLGARYLAGAAGLQVGGDWYDVLPLPDGRVAFALGDVVGKGLPAAAAMGQVRYALRAYAALDPAPAAVLTALDDFFEARDAEEIVTLVYGVLDPGEGVLVWSNGGHPPPLLVGTEQTRIVSGLADGTPLGVSSPRQESTMQLAAGDLLLLYSDGLVEARDRPVGEGVDALVRIAEGPDLRENSADGATGAVLARMLDGRDADDDATLLALRWRGPASAEADVPDPSQDPPHVATTRLRPEALASSSARRFVRSLLERWQLLELADPAELCVSELVTNAVLHARTPINLEVRAGQGVLHVDVCDSGGSRIDLPPREEPADALESGRGLFIVQALSSRTGVVPRTDGMCVWFELDLPNVSGEAAGSGDGFGRGDLDDGPWTTELD